MSMLAEVGCRDGKDLDYMYICTIGPLKFNVSSISRSIDFLCYKERFRDEETVLAKAVASVRGTAETTKGELNKGEEEH